MPPLLAQNRKQQKEIKVKHLEIKITADIPDGNEEVGHEAIVACKEPMAAVAETLQDLGLKVETQRKLVTRRGEKKSDPAAPPKLVA